MGKSSARRKRAKEEDDVNAAEVAMAKAVQGVQEIVSEHSEEEIRAMLLECNMNQNFAINRLLSLPRGASNEQGTSTQIPDSSTTTTTSSVLVPNQSDLPNVPVSSGEALPLSSEPSSSAITNGETRNVPISSSEAVPSFSVPSSSDVTNGETSSVPISSTEAVLSLPVPSTRSVPISSGEAVPPMSVSSSRPLLTKAKPKRQESRMISATGPSMAEVLWGLHGPSKQNVTNAPLKADDSPLKPHATNPISRSVTESDAAARDPHHSAFPMATASPLGPRPQTSISMADINSFFSSEEFQQRSGSSNSYTLAHDGDMINPHYLWRQAHNNVPSSEALQQPGGGTNNDTCLYQSLDSVFSRYRNSSLPSGNAANSMSIPRVHLPSSNSSGGASSIGPSWHVNGSNSRLGYGDYLPPVHLQGSRSSTEWTVQSEEIYFISAHWRSPGYRPSQQERDDQRRIGYERLRGYNASLNQENNASDPSDQT